VTVDDGENVISQERFAVVERRHQLHVPPLQLEPANGTIGERNSYGSDRRDRPAHIRFQRPARQFELANANTART
jgi:hypothetical protein